MSDETLVLTKEGKQRLEEELHYLEKLGFNVIPVKYNCKNTEEVINAINDIGKNREKLTFGIDGADEVSLGVFDNNASAQNCYKSVGFKENGVREEYSIAGEKWIDIEMEIHKK